MNQRLVKFQTELYAMKEEKKDAESGISEMNMIERLMFNVQTSDLIEEGTKPVLYA